MGGRWLTLSFVIVLSSVNFWTAAQFEATQSSRPIVSELVSNLFLQGPPIESEEPIPRFPAKQRLRMSESCLACICAASTNCKLTTRCVSKGQYCGPFLISRPYWTDAGTPVLLSDAPERDGAFEDCALDPVCSAQTVRKYMTKFQKDCNGDGEINCDDLARIHLMGPFGTECSNPALESTGFYNKFLRCWNSVLRLSFISPPLDNTNQPINV